MPLPKASHRYPVTLPDGTEHLGTVLLNQAIDHPRFQAGDYSYASDFEAPTDWASRLAPYLYPSSRERLVIGKFCQIAHGVRFITSSANHAMDGATCFPFPVFDPAKLLEYQPDTRDTVIGNDVWIAYGALIMPGAKIGDGTIVGAGSVVRGTIPPYAVVTGNPAEVRRFRFDQDTIDRLLALKWWDWPADRISEAEEALLSGNIELLEQMAS
ncbi:MULTISPECIES: CatB-related O-acetyltransferase [unclassified Ruegeria]|uniref:CatB-related O-acetyltransferase n=1 Tax=unclassified Ruegeria TaxID=2625375 RepID=UPI001488F335|nr:MULTISPECIES: CatB-related O-acetyltransferase [unclassified Ruegeria]NOD77071.1 antibiotic acetyltransferase [Ruegeria sp. HKCCD4332]NOD89542.1 antibiotic acetyltransferase [Ruegeria sp. HKCCD4318]NOE13865.1 antibiotic acetyltransferase [Ruegeria sp. HKCCD4318-2]NOG08200.1 CatB-related O-acetyltransferase [Ruegeria sp. HKCCD4315]